tara:strand:- start:421 stop:1608 length:1188 start_codon:yes stop_codon:yes gene_type:complete
MPILTEYPINASVDALLDSLKVTSGYFPGGVGELVNDLIYTGSLTSTNENFYFNINDNHPSSASSDVCWSVAYGHVNGSGSKIETGTKGETKAVYGQWAQTLLNPNEVSGGFRISMGDGNVTPGTAAAQLGHASPLRDQDVYVLVGKRARYKDRVNKKNWTITFSGSISDGTENGPIGSDPVSGSGKALSLTDDSSTVTAVATPAGPRHNIVSGSDGTVVTAASTTTYGWFYPNVGVLIFSAAELSKSISGPMNAVNISGSYEHDLPLSVANAITSSGFAPNLDTANDAANAVKFIQCMQHNGARLKFRAEEDQTSVSYFCRVRANEGNFSNNVTYVSGSANRLRQKSMWGNPTTYITGIQLLNSNKVVVATGKLSSPLKKNFQSEATIKVKLTY